MTTKAIFMGTPTFAIPSLEALVRLDEIDVIMVITQPDKPAGRGQKLHPSPVKARALELGLPVWTPQNLKKAEEQQRLRELQPDVMVVVAYGEILRPAVLKIAPHGAVNIHGSLLPRHRGAAPLAAALLAGDKETGATMMLMDKGMDTGPILATASIPIESDDTRDSLFEKVSRLGADLLYKKLPAWLAREIEPQSQNHDAATYTRQLEKKDGRLEWNQPAKAIANQIRAFDPWPGTFTRWHGKNLKVLKGIALPADTTLPTTAPGTVIQVDKTIAVTTAEGWLALEKVQLAGKKAMDVHIFVNGYRDFVGSVLG